MRKAILIPVLILSSFELFSQSLNPLQFSLQHIIPGYDLGEPSSTYHSMKGRIMHFILQGNKYAVVMTDSRGAVVWRNVCDFDKNQSYYVGDWGGKWIYSVDTIPGNSPFHSNQNSAIDVLYTGLKVQPNKVEYKGFSCYQITLMSRQYGKVTLIATDQIAIPTKPLDPNFHPNLLDSVVILKALFENEKHKVEAAVDTLYSTVQNPEWLIPFQEGAITREENEKLEFKKVMSSSYDNQVKKGENLDIGIALYDNGLLSEMDIKSALEANVDVDKLLLMKQTEYLSRAMSCDSLIRVWNKAGLLSPAIKLKMDQYKMQHWKDSRELFFSMMSLLMLNELLADIKNRETIIANMSLNHYRFKDGAEVIKSDFINGKVDASALLMEVDGMYPIPPFYVTKDKSKIEREVKELLIQVFPMLTNQLKVWITLDSTSRRLHVDTKDYQYRVDIYRDYSREDEEGSIKLPKLKEYSFNAEFLADIEPLFKQIGTDYQNDRIYGFRTFARSFNEIEEKDYEELTKKYPELSLFKNLWYLGALDRELASWMADIKISFRNTDLTRYQAQINSLYHCSTFVDYLPSEKKKMVIDFMQRYRTDLNLSDEMIKTVIDNMQYELIQSDDEIGGFIPGIQFIALRQYPEAFLEEIPANKKFSDFFPRLYGFIRQDFNPVLMGLSEDASELYWKDDSGKIDTIPMDFHSTEESILIFLHKKLAPTGYGIYSIPTLMITSRQYYYLSQQQKNDLENILGTHFIGIK